MRVVSYLPPHLLPRLADAVRDVEATHILALTWEEVEAALQDAPDSIVVLDPHTDGSDRTGDVSALLKRFPLAAVLVYTEFNPAALKTLTTLMPQGAYESILFQVDDTRARFSRLLTRASTYGLVVRLVDELRPQCRLLPVPLGDAVLDLFRRPQAYTAGCDLILAGRTPSTTLQRALGEAGLAPPKQLLVAARVLHAVAYLRDPKYTVEQAAQYTGYQYARILTQHTLAVFGVRPSQLRAMPDEEALGRLLAWSRKPATQEISSPVSGETEI